MKIFYGKTGRVLRAVGCRISDRVSEGKNVSAIEAALARAVDMAVQKEVAAQIEERRREEEEAQRIEAKRLAFKSAVEADLWPVVAHA